MTDDNRLRDQLCAGALYVEYRDSQSAASFSAIFIAIDLTLVPLIRAFSPALLVIEVIKPGFR